MASCLDKHSPLVLLVSFCRVLMVANEMIKQIPKILSCPHHCPSRSPPYKIHSLVFWFARSCCSLNWFVGRMSMGILAEEYLQMNLTWITFASGKERPPLGFIKLISCFTPNYTGEETEILRLLVQEYSNSHVVPSPFIYRHTSSTHTRHNGSSRAGKLFCPHDLHSLIANQSKSSDWLNCLLCCWWITSVTLCMAINSVIVSLLFQARM